MYGLLFYLAVLPNHKRYVLSIRVHSPWASNENIMNFEGALYFTFLKARGFTFGINKSRYKRVLQSSYKPVFIELNPHKSSTVTIEGKDGKWLYHAFRWHC